MIDVDRLVALDDAQLADELDEMVERARAKRIKGPQELAEICALVPLLTKRLRRHVECVDLPPMELR